jgi:uncharacterized protein YcbK (DUF882 family)
VTQLTKNFTLEEAITLPKWGVLASDMNDCIMRNIMHTAERMEVVRKLCGHKKVNVHCWYRPLKYNMEVDGAFFSAHLFGLGVDFDIEDLSCDEVRKILAPHLRALGLRMEDNPGSTWVHLDCMPVCMSRVFKPA